MRAEAEAERGVAGRRDDQRRRQDRPRDPHHVPLEPTDRRPDRRVRDVGEGDQPFQRVNVRVLEKARRQSRQERAEHAIHHAVEQFTDRRQRVQVRADGRTDAGSENALGLCPGRAEQQCHPHADGEEEHQAYATARHAGYATRVGSAAKIAIPTPTLNSMSFARE